MKKFFLVIILIISSLFYSDIYAGTIKVKVPAKVPWVDCVQTMSDVKTQQPSQYECTVETWFWSVKDSIWQIVKYFTFITWLAWVLFIIFNWIKLSMAWINPEYEKEAKDNIKKTLFWLILLLLSWLVLNFIAPWVYS